MIIKQIYNMLRIVNNYKVHLIVAFLGYFVGVYEAKLELRMFSRWESKLEQKVEQLQATVSKQGQLLEQLVKKQLEEKTSKKELSANN